MIRVVLPAYNEEEALRELLPAIGEALAGREYQVLVVDDGSADGTAQVAEEWAARLPVRLIPHPVNQGLAAAILTGLTAALEEASPEDPIVTMDADNTHLPEQIPSMIELVRGGADVVVASRYQRGARVHGVSGFRQFLSGGASLLFRTVLPLRGLRDYTCGYRVYRARVLSEALPEIRRRLTGQESFSCMVDILLVLRAQGVKLAEVPMILRYDRKPGLSKMPVARTVKDTLRILLRERFSRTRTRTR